MEKVTLNGMISELLILDDIVGDLILDEKYLVKRIEKGIKVIDRKLLILLMIFFTYQI